MTSLNAVYALEHLSVLILDENLHMRHLIREILLALGIRDTSLVSNVPQAFKELRHFTADIIITDWHLEPLDGFEFVKLVRTALDNRNPFVPIIMLSAGTEAKYLQNARDAGVNEFLAKPVSAKSLYQRILSLIDHPRKFLKTKNYVGPDRRRHDDGPAIGKSERRSVMPETNNTEARSV